jgi:hypothetical protein
MMGVIYLKFLKMQQNPSSTEEKENYFLSKAVESIESLEVFA